MQPKAACSNKEIHSRSEEVCIMRTEQIYYALMVAKCGSFSKAAELLYIKQQSVRAAINHLEDELGVTLFARTQKGVSLTDQGQETLRKLQDMLDIYEGIKYTSNELKNRRKNPRWRQFLWLESGQSNLGYLLYKISSDIDPDHRRKFSPKFDRRTS